MKTKFFTRILLLTVALVTLTACGAKKESPEVVIQKSKEAMADVKSGLFDMDLGLKASDPKQGVDIKAGLKVKFDRADDANRKGDVTLDVSGSSTLGGKSISGEASAAIVTIGPDFYFKIEKLDVNDPSVQAVKLMAAAYFNKWLHISNEFLPKDVRDVTSKSPEELAKEEQLKKLFIDSNVFAVTKEYGIESVNGEKAYHYGVSFNAEGMKDYMRKAAVIENPELTEAELQAMDADLDKSLAMLSSISNAELWLGQKDYYPYKGTFTVNGDILQDGVTMGLEVSFEGSGFNEDQKITAPSDFKEFDPISLISGAGSLQAPSVPAVEVPAENQ